MALFCYIFVLDVFLFYQHFPIRTTYTCDDITCCVMFETWYGQWTFIQRNYRSGEDSKNRICPRTKRYPLQSIQDVSKAFTQTMEPSKCDMEKRQSPRVLATGRRNIYTQGEGIETCDRLPNNLFAECRGENIRCCTRKTYAHIPSNKSVHRHISTSTNQYIDTSVQKGCAPWFSGCLEHTSAISQARHRQCLWINTTHADWWSIESLQHPRTCTGDHQWLFWWLAALILSWRGDSVMAEVRERNTDWLHHLSSTIRNGQEPNH